MLLGARHRGGIAALLALRGHQGSKLGLPAALGWGVPGLAALERLLDGQSCSLTVVFGSLIGCVWHSSGAACFLSLHPC